MYTTSMDSPVGKLHLFADDLALRQIIFPARIADAPEAIPAPPDHDLLRAAVAQLSEYFSGRRTEFDLPIAPCGTPFQQAVWQLIGRIEYGSSRTYGQLAARLGNPNKARAVGGAANKNPLPLLIPCHRVLGASGSLTGFAGGLEVKQLLLNLEKNGHRGGIEYYSSPHMT